MECSYPVCGCPAFGAGSVLCSTEQALVVFPSPGVYLVTTGGSSRRVGDSLGGITDESAEGLLGCATLRYQWYVGELDALSRPHNPKASALLGVEVRGGVLLEYAA